MEYLSWVKVYTVFEKVVLNYPVADQFVLALRSFGL
jgi:hypothetical protein